MFRHTHSAYPIRRTPFRILCISGTFTRRWQWSVPVVFLLFLLTATLTPSPWQAQAFAQSSRERGDRNAPQNRPSPFRSQYVTVHTIPDSAVGWSLLIPYRISWESIPFKKVPGQEIYEAEVDVNLQLFDAEGATSTSRRSRPGDGDVRTGRRGTDVDNRGGVKGDLAKGDQKEAEGGRFSEKDLKDLTVLARMVNSHTLRTSAFDSTQNKNVFLEGYFLWQSPDVSLREILPVFEVVRTGREGKAVFLPTTPAANRVEMIALSADHGTEDGEEASFWRLQNLGTVVPYGQDVSFLVMISDTLLHRPAHGDEAMTSGGNATGTMRNHGASPADSLTLRVRNAKSGSELFEISTPAKDLGAWNGVQVWQPRKGGPILISGGASRMSGSESVIIGDTIAPQDAPSQPSPDSTQIRSTSPSASSTSMLALVVNVPGSRFPNEPLLVQLLIGERLIHSARYTSLWRDIPLSLLNVEVSIDAMKWILPEKEFEAMQKGSMQEKINRFFEWWAPKDPSPETHLNELMVEYFRRVDTTVERYSSPSQRGYRSDQGKTYILYGEPVTVERSFPPGGAARELWIYPQARFLFEATSGFGDFKLIETTVQ